MVVEDELDTGLPYRLAAARAIKDDVGHRLATEVFGRALTHHPAHSIDNIGFATAIRPDYGAEIRGEVDCGGIDEGFEAG